MSKMEVRVVLKNGEVEEYNPVDIIMVSVQDGYDYDFRPEDIKSIEIYPMDNSTKSQSTKQEDLKETKKG